MARQVTARLARAVETGEIGLEALFDDDYQPVAGSDPQQVTTRATAFLEGVLPEVQEPPLQRDTRIIFCACVDRNGYLPVHNVVYSKPQRRGEPEWNAANCRNRRIFDDRAGLAAARNSRPQLVQSYSRDMGDGSLVLMKEVDVPIQIAKRHWGAVRLAFKI